MFTIIERLVMTYDGANAGNHEQHEFQLVNHYVEDFSNADVEENTLTTVSAHSYYKNYNDAKNAFLLMAKKSLTHYESQSICIEYWDTFSVLG